MLETFLFHTNEPVFLVELIALILVGSDYFVDFINNFT